MTKLKPPEPAPIETRLAELERRVADLEAIVEYLRRWAP